MGIFIFTGHTTSHNKSTVRHLVMNSVKFFFRDKVYCGIVFIKIIFHSFDRFFNLFFISTFLGNSTFGNKDYTLDFIKNLTGTTDTRVGLVVNQTQTNTLDISASSAVIQTIGLGLFTIVVPVAVLVIGLVIFLRRRHL